MRTQNRRSRTRAVLFSLSVAIALSILGALRWSAVAHATPAQSLPAAAASVASDNLQLQRSTRLDTYTLIGDHGAARGENIYAYKCWMCHNQYAKGGPYLKNLYQRPTLMSGEPVNDQTVTQKIKDGGPGMPAFGTTLSDDEIADLVTYFKEGKCCVEGENPPANPWYRAEKDKWPVQSGLSGGPTGVVRVASGDSPEGIGVQLVAPNGVRTTVYTNPEGKYEFPKMKAGAYILRIPTPLLFKPYRRDAVEINGANKLEDITLERVSKTDALPATPEIESQLSGAEVLWNVPGTAQEKATLQKDCSGCHGWQQIFRNRYDERSWSLILDRMMHYSGTSLVVRVGGRGGVQRGDAASDVEYNTLVNWLSKVRAPGYKDEPLRVFPRPQGAATHVVVTEYELPQALLMPHDVAGDAQGNIWFSSHKTRYVGKLDPRTGIITEYQLPLNPGAMPGTHAVRIDKNGIPWFSENWAHKLVRLDPKTGDVSQVTIPSSVPINAPAFGNFSLSPDGFVWDSREQKARKIDPETGKILQEFPLQVSFSYDNLISQDGKYYAGGGLPNWGNTAERLDIQTGQWLNLNTGDHMATAKRGGFDPYNNAWFGGGDGALIELDAKAGRIVEHRPPIAPSPFTDFYEAMPDKNGEVWAGVLHGRQMLRLDPRTERWIVYQMPEPFSYDRRTWIDGSTNPVTVWYIDYDGYIVRVQPRD
jgi:streptogramin lyase/mono/diheme cytochrome c family protein